MYIRWKSTCYLAKFIQHKCGYISSSYLTSKNKILGSKSHWFPLQIRPYFDWPYYDWNAIYEFLVQSKSPGLNSSNSAPSSSDSLSESLAIDGAGGFGWGTGGALRNLVDLNHFIQVMFVTSEPDISFWPNYPKSIHRHSFIDQSDLVLTMLTQDS